jgi:predicted Holliday junction resolvase-like endonuclease
MAGGGYLGYVFFKKEFDDCRSLELPEIPPSQVHVDLEPLRQKLEAMPTKVLQSIQGSVNNKKGALGELIGMIELKVEYDRVIPLGSIVDFVCIKFPTGDSEGTVDFVDVKTGGKKRLSAAQRDLQKLIDAKQINFIKLKVETECV